MNVVTAIKVVTVAVLVGLFVVAVIALILVVNI